MRNIALLALLPVLIAACGNQKNARDGFIVKKGMMAPDFVINEASGKSYRLSDLRGRVVMLQFTASWCSVCRTEMPFIEKDIWKVKQNDSIVIIGIDRGEPIETVIDFQKSSGVTYPLALDASEEIFRLYAKKEAGVTRNVIIDRKGKIIWLTRLYKPSEFEKMKSVIFAELSRKP